jgi:phage repressor protein C with HTH and peptisase S24 domain
MRSLLFSKRPNKPKKHLRRPRLLIRRVVGDSMLPFLKSDQIVLAVGTFKTLQPGDVVVFRHEGLEKIKRIHSIKDEYVFLVGDNADISTDSRTFGWLHVTTVVAKVRWPASDKTKNS